MEEMEEEKNEEPERILANEHLHRTVEISITSSSSHRTGPHVHGVDDRVDGRFWALGSNSESEDDEYNAVQLVNVFVDHGSKLQPMGSDVQVVGKKSPKGLKVSGEVARSKVSP
jgi:hypothetical protein